MRLFFDTEFIEDGKTIELLSIGVVAEDGREYYAESIDALPHYDRADPWVKENVIAHLRGGDTLKSRAEIASDLIYFAGPRPEFWAYYADYDWVALCQLFGRMIDLPSGEPTHWPMFCRDVKQFAMDLGNPELPEQTSIEHHALEDARWVKDAWTYLMQRGR